MALKSEARSLPRRPKGEREDKLESASAIPSHLCTREYLRKRVDEHCGSFTHLLF